MYCPYGVCYPRERYSIFGVERQRKAVLRVDCGYPACQLFRLGAVLYSSSEYIRDDAFYCCYAASVLYYDRPLAAEHVVNFYRGHIPGDTFHTCADKSER